jgi:hypothetical protein
LESLERCGVPDYKWDGVSDVVTWNGPLPPWRRLCAPGYELAFRRAVDDLFRMIMSRTEVIVPPGCTLMISGMYRRQKHDPVDRTRRSGPSVICKRPVIIHTTAEGKTLGRIDPTKEVGPQLLYMGDMRIRTGEADATMMHIANLFSGHCITSQDRSDASKMFGYYLKGVKAMPGIPGVVLRTADSDAIPTALINSHKRITDPAKNITDDAMFINRLCVDVYLSAQKDEKGVVIDAAEKKRRKKAGEEEGILHEEDEIVDINLLYHSVWRAISSVAPEKPMQDPVSTFVCALKMAGDDYVKPAVQGVPHQWFFRAICDYPDFVGDMVSFHESADPKKAVRLNVTACMRLLHAAYFACYDARQFDKKSKLRKQNSWRHRHPKDLSWRELQSEVKKRNPKQVKFWSRDATHIKQRMRRLWWTIIYNTHGIDGSPMPPDEEMGWELGEDGKLQLRDA